MYGIGVFLRRAACSVLALCLLFALLVPAAAAPAVSAASAALYCPATGEFAFTQNADARRGMASTTKIMTALVAIENGDADAEIVIPGAAVGVEGSSLYLKAGEKMTLRDLLYGLLLQSANDAAEAIAIAIGGSVEGFADLMNEKAAAMGLTDTHFTNPHGLADENHYTTARELAKIAAEAMQQPLFCEICGARRAAIPNGEGGKRYLVNHNKLLFTYAGAIGVKTGFTKKAGRCLVSAAEKDGVRLICVTLNCPDDWNTHAALYQRYFALTESRPLTLEAPILPVVGGQKAALQTVLVGQPTYTAIRGREEGITVTVYLNRGFCYAPVEAGQPLGQVVWRRGDHVIGTAVLAAGESIPTLESHRPWWQKLYG